MRKIVFLFLWVSLAISFGSASAQQPLSAQYLDYIERYRNIAISQQNKYGIPASITLAQGLLESQCGNSRLAFEGNNHFGIKCHNWAGDTITHDDDELQECFRKYDTPEQSYEDHSVFLQRPRYKPLFELDRTDYRAWATTLRRCGYATDPAYPEKLIRIIETYELHKFDNETFAEVNEEIKQTSEEIAEAETTAIAIETSNNDTQQYNRVKNAFTQHNVAEQSTTQLSHPVRRSWGLNFILTYNGDSYETISKEFDVKVKDLLRFNDLKKSPGTLSEGEIVYLQEKSKKAIIGYSSHVVIEGETLRSVAQYYGIKVAALMSLNSMKKEQPLTAGQVLRLR